jgi:UDP-glucose 4-epimerase
LIPNILKSTFKKSDKFQIYGDDYDTKDGTCIRDYVNIDDLVDAHILALEYLNKTNQSNVLNIGTSQGNSVKEVFDLCENILGQQIDYEICPRRAGDPDKLFADANKAKEILGWVPKRRLDYSIKTAYEWEKKLQSI